MTRPLVRFIVTTGTICALGLVAVPTAEAEQTQPAGNVAEVRDEITRLRQDFEAVKQQYDARLIALEARLIQLGGSQPAAPSTPTAADAAATTASQNVIASSSKIFNPDTSVIGNFVGVAGKNPASDQSPLELTEAEAAFQAVVDPYARADFFLAASPEGLEVEEGFVTFTALPSNLLLKVGKMRAPFGKVNALHTHAMPTVDRPLVTENLLGGEEGISDSGLSLSRLIANPLFFLEATAEVYAGNSAVFQSDRRSHLTYLGRVRAYRDITEDKNVDLGASFAFGSTDGALQTLVPLERDLHKRLVAVDATFRYRPLRRAIYRRLNLRTELVWSRQDLEADAVRAFGFYGLGEYQFARRWYIGARVDRSGRVFDELAVDKGGSVFVTFWPTEFSQIRGQYRRTMFADSEPANEILFQFNFAIGAHGAHTF